MLRLYGARYIIDHCYAEREKEQRQQALEYYITDTLQLIGMNIAGLTKGKYISSSWRDICEGTKCDDAEKTGDEIAAEVVNRIGLTFGDK